MFFRKPVEILFSTEKRKELKQGLLNIIGLFSKSGLKADIFHDHDTETIVFWMKGSPGIVEAVKAAIKDKLLNGTVRAYVV